MRDENNRWEQVSVVITDHRGMTRWHDRYLGEARTTDVLSFAYPPLPGAEDRYTGEVVVNAEQALDCGPRFRGVERELALYLAHGCHHLSGADDRTPGERAHMRRIENGWLRRAERLGLMDSGWLKPAPTQPR